MTQASLFDQRAGEQARDRALDSLELTAAEWLGGARAAARALYLLSGRVTSDEVLASVGPLPAHLHPNTMGVIFRPPLWEIVSYRKSSRKSRHAARIGVWVYTGRE